MKYNKSLVQVWKWKESIYNQVRKLPLKKQLDFIISEAKKNQERSSIRLKGDSGAHFKHVSR